MPGNRRRVVLLLAYDGSRYAGSQYQKNAPTVQAALEEAIQRTTGGWVRAAFAGRTDAGVHAKGQVASFLTESSLPLATLQRALNFWLPHDIVAWQIATAPADFDVRRHAGRRHYRYLVDNSATRPALTRAYVWHVRQRLDVETMAAAARTLVGRRDFAAFASPVEGGRSTVRTLFCFSLRRDGRRVVFDAVADAFLPHQVRRMVGALVQAGLGRRSVEEYAALLKGPPASAGPVAPPHGLYLMGVEYEWFRFDTAPEGCLP
jgi:tRNA pseudouridine38-40 synthase